MANLLIEMLVANGTLDPEDVEGAEFGGMNGDPELDENGEPIEFEGEEVKNFLSGLWAGGIRTVTPTDTKQVSDRSVMNIFGNNLDRPAMAADTKAVAREDARQAFLAEMAGQVLSAKPVFTHSQKVARRNQGMRLQDRGAG